jgi:hypothetical protein
MPKCDADGPPVEDMVWRLSFAELRAIVPPPAEPLFGGDPGMWDAVERALGARLPHYYKCVVNAYGMGFFGQYICPLNPLSPVPFVELVHVSRMLPRMYGKNQRLFPEYSAPFPFFPSPGGLLPWGRDDNGGYQYWLIHGDPDEWTVVVCDEEFSQTYDTYPLSMTGFLCQWLTGRVKVAFFPTEEFDPTAPPLFVQSAKGAL